MIETMDQEQLHSLVMIDPLSHFLAPFINRDTMIGGAGANGVVYFSSLDGASSLEGTPIQCAAKGILAYVRLKGGVSTSAGFLFADKVRERIRQGIHTSQCVVLLLTKKYLKAVLTLDSNDLSCYEYFYALARLGAAKMIAVALEDGIIDSAEWAKLTARAAMTLVDFTGLSSLAEAEQTCSQLLSVVTLAASYDLPPADLIDSRLSKAFSSRQKKKEEEVQRISKELEEAFFKVVKARGLSKPEAPVLIISHNDGIYSGPLIDSKASSSGVCAWVSGERKGNVYKGNFASK